MAYLVCNIDFNEGRTRTEGNRGCSDICRARCCCPEICCSSPSGLSLSLVTAMEVYAKEVCPLVIYSFNIFLLQIS